MFLDSHLPNLGIEYISSYTGAGKTWTLDDLHHVKYPIMQVLFHANRKEKKVWTPAAKTTKELFLGSQHFHAMMKY